MIIGLDDVEDYMGRTLSGDEVSAASPIVGYIQRELEDGYLGRRLEVESHTESKQLYPATNFVELTYGPIVSVQSVAIDGVPQQPLAWSIERSGIQLFTAFSVIGILYPSVVTVVYTAGLGEPAISAARRVVLARVARIIEKRASDELGVSKLVVEKYNAVWMPEDDFTDPEKNAVKRWKKRRVSRSPEPFGMTPYDMGRTYDPFSRYD
jgi:hypothetical protein